MRINQLSLAIMAVLPGAVFADEPPCFEPLTAFDQEHKLAPNEIRVSSDRAEIRDDTEAEFEGKVDILSATSRIKANTARINRNQQQLNAIGDVSYRDAQIRVQSDDVLLNTDTGKLSMDNTEYRLAQLNGRGSAETITLSTEEGIELQDVTYSACPVGNEDWMIKASSISLQEGEAWGEATNTRFYVKGVPVFYLPYFVFPVSDERQTGLLFPIISSSTSTGISYEQPYYWNIAPNFDATIAPRIMSNRGTQLKTEFRYLSEQHQGQLNLEYIPSDTDVRSNESEDRYFYRYVHYGKLSENWAVSADINGLSDDNYIVDLGSDFYNRADTHLFQTLGVNYQSENLDFSAFIRDFEIIGDSPSTYRALPELKLNYQSDPLAGVEFRLQSELAYFDNTQADAPKATRLHVAPSVVMPFRRTWGEFLAETSVLNTYYKQENIGNTGLDDEVNRTLGQVRLYGALNFERDTSWFGNAVSQTLEPKVQYLFTSYEDQNNIGLYDTILLFNDFEGLFRGVEFTGLDRISDNNQITLGVTSRILDENNREQFKFSVGQIFYLDDNQVLEATKDDDRSVLAAEVDWQIGSKWFAHAEAQVSSITDKVERSSISLEYQLGRDKIVQLSHRFVRDLSGEEINQVGVTASWPIAKDWHWVGRWYKDLELQRTIESYTGIQYESCCWSVRLVAQRHLSNRFNAAGMQGTEEFESGINFKFTFKFGGDEAASGRRRMLEDGLFGYRQPYLLN